MTRDELVDFVRAGLIAQGKLPGGPKVPPADVERGIHYPDVPPSPPEETDEQYTERLTDTARSPYDHARRRECSIGWHLTCSDPQGAACECPCHKDRAGSESGVTATNAAATLAKLYYLPIRTGQNVVATVRYRFLAVMSGVGEKVPFEAVKDAIEEIRPYYSRPGDGFAVDVVKILELDEYTEGMPS